MVISGHQRSSEAIRGDHRRSEAIIQSRSVEVSRGQSRVESSYPPPLISRQPSVPRHVTDPVCPSSTCCVRPVRKSHTRIEWSRDPVKSTDAPSWAGPPSVAEGKAVHGAGVALEAREARARFQIPPDEGRH